LSHAVVDTATSTVYISGQVDWDMNHQVSSHTVEGQLSKALTNLTIVLDAAGSSIRICNVRIYIQGEFGEFLEDIAPILTQYLGESRPALTVALPHSLLQNIGGG